MMMDFDRFTTAAKLAYRRCGGSAYTLEEVLQVFRYYFDTYEMLFDAEHPMISIQQIARIIEKMPFVVEEEDNPPSHAPGEEDGYSRMIDLLPEDYDHFIDSIW